MNAKNISSPKKIKQKQFSPNHYSPPSTNKELSVKKSPTAIKEKCVKNMTDPNEGISNSLKNNRKRKQSEGRYSAKRKNQKPMNASTDIISQEELESIFKLQ